MALRLSVIGTGYLGATHAACMAELGYEVIGYDVDEATHTLTHHVQGSVTRDLLVGKDLPRIYQFTRDGI